jgi:hypothetical protein
LQAKIGELENNSNIKILRDLYRGTNDFKKGYHSRTNIVKDEKYLETATIFWLGGGNISFRYSMYMGLTLLDRQKYIQHRH